MTDPVPSLLSLPGPSVHLDDICADLADGLSCVWLVPDGMVGSGAADELLDELAARSDHVRPLPGRWPGPARRPASAPAVVAAPAWSGPLRPADERPSWVDDELALVSWDPPAVVVAAPAPLAKPTVTLAERFLVELEPGMAATGTAGGVGFSTDDARAGGGDPVAALIASPAAGGKVVVIAAWHEQDPDGVGNLVARIVTSTRGRPVAERPRVLVGARLADLSPTFADRLDPLHCRVHWWWGRTSLSDTAVVVSMARPAAGRRRAAAGYAQLVRELVSADVVAELAGPDLMFARRLAATWDGRMSTLRTAADLAADVVPDVAVVDPVGTPASEPAQDALTGAGGGVALAVWQPRGRHWEQPPRPLRAAWAAGTVDAWGGQVVVSLRAVVPGDRDAERERRVWRGQHRALTPLIDEYRALVERAFRAKASMATLGRIATAGRRTRLGAARAEPAAMLELQEMYWAVKDGWVQLPRVQWTLLRKLYEARNALAHLRPLTDTQIDALADAIGLAAS